MIVSSPFSLIRSQTECTGKDESQIKGTKYCSYKDWSIALASIFFQSGRLIGEGGVMSGMEIEQWEKREKRERYTVYTMPKIAGRCWMGWNPDARHERAECWRSPHYDILPAFLLGHIECPNATPASHQGAEAPKRAPCPWARPDEPAEGSALDLQASQGPCYLLILLTKYWLKPLMLPPCPAAFLRYCPDLELPCLSLM